MIQKIAHTKKRHKVLNAMNVYKLVPEREYVLWNMDRLWEERPMWDNP